MWIGSELVLDSYDHKIIKKGGRAIGAAGRVHNLEVLLHLIDPDRDIALMNKSEDALVVRPFMKYKGCVPVEITHALQMTGSIVLYGATKARPCYFWEWDA